MLCVVLIAGTLYFLHVINEPVVQRGYEGAPDKSKKRRVW